MKDYGNSLTPVAPGIKRLASLEVSWRTKIQNYLIVLTCPSSFRRSFKTIQLSTRSSMTKDCECNPSWKEIKFNWFPQKCKNKNQFCDFVVCFPFWMYFLSNFDCIAQLLLSALHAQRTVRWPAFCADSIVEFLNLMQTIADFPVWIPGYREVFAKESPYKLRQYLAGGDPGFMEQVLPQSYIHTFLIRQPAKYIASLYKVTSQGAAGQSESYRLKTQAWVPSGFMTGIWVLEASCTSVPCACFACVKIVSDE